jgi:hypothetical protein
MEVLLKYRIKIIKVDSRYFWLLFETKIKNKHGNKIVKILSANSNVSVMYILYGIKKTKRKTYKYLILSLKDFK